MNIRKKILAVLALCLFMTCTVTVNAQDVSEYTEVENDFVNQACAMQYSLDGKVYRITSSGRLALEREMTTVDLSESDADALLSSTVTEKKLEEQLAKGYIEIVSDDAGSSQESSSDNSESLSESTADESNSSASAISTTENNGSTNSQTQTGKDIWNAAISDSENSKNSSATTDEKNYFVSPEDVSDGTSTDSDDETSTDSDGISGTSSGKSTSTSSSKDTSTSSGKSTSTSSFNTTDQNSTMAESIVDRVLQTLEADKAEENKNSLLSDYKMPSQDEAAVGIIYEEGSDEMQIVDADGNTLLSYSDSDITSQEIEGNIIHIEWLIPLVLVFAFISVICMYIAYKQKFFREEPKSKKKKAVRGVLMAVLFGNTILVLAAAVAFSGLLRTSNVIEGLNSSSYYEHAYADMAENTVRILEENDLDNSLLVDTLGYQEFVLTMRQYTEKKLDSSGAKLDLSEEQDVVEEVLDNYYKTQEEQELAQSETEETKAEKKARKAERKEKVSVITNSVISNYKKYVDFYPAHLIKQIKRDAKAVLQLVVPAAILTAIFDMIGISLISYKKTSLLFYSGISVSAAGLLGTILTAFIYIKKTYADVYISPEYLYQFFLVYANNAVKMGLVVSVFIAILGAMLIFLGLKVRNHK